MIRKLLAGMCYSQARWSMGLGRLGMAHAYRLLRLACALSPRHLEACQWFGYLRGRVALEAGRPEEALELLREADRALPEVVAVRASLGLAYTMAGKHEQAISAFERLLKESPAEMGEEVWASLAWSYLRSGRAPKAREVCLRAWELDVRTPRLDLMHRLATGVGLGSLPVSEVRELVKIVPQSLSLLLEYARLQAHEGRHRLARTAVSVLPEDQEARAYSIIGHASLNEDDAATAAWAAEQMVRTKDDQYLPEAALLRSEVGLRKGDVQDAVAQARRGLEADPDNGRLREQLGRALLLQGKWDEATAQMIEALHTGQAGALAAGLAALGALEAGDTAAAGGLFLAPRQGDGLATLVASVAQARLMIAEERWPEALALAERSVEGLREMPAWARAGGAVERLAAVLSESLAMVEGEEAQKLRAKLAAVRPTPNPLSRGMQTSRGREESSEPH